MFSFFKRETSSTEKSTPRSVQTRKKHLFDHLYGNVKSGTQESSSRFRRRHRSGDILSMVAGNDTGSDINSSINEETHNGQKISTIVYEPIQSIQSYSLASTNNASTVQTTSINTITDQCNQPQTPTSSQRFIREVIVERRQSDNLFNIQIEDVVPPDAIVSDKLSKLRVQGAGFLSDDRLLSLNGRQLGASTDAVRVNRIIRSLAGKTLVVQVLSVVLTNGRSSPDSSESVRSSTPVRGSIKRFGTVRNSAAAAHHIFQDVTKQNINSLYWLVNESQIPSYSLVQLHRETSTNSAVVSRVSMPGQTFEAGIDRLEKANFPEFDMSDQLSNLQFINESSLLHVLRTRYISSYPFTAIGSLLIALPSADKKEDTKHTVAILDEISSMRSEHAPPHILSSVVRLYRDAVCSDGGEQHSLCLLGQADCLKRTLARKSHLAICLLANKGVPPVRVQDAVTAFCDIIDIVSCSCYHSGNFVYSSLQQNAATISRFVVNSRGRLSSVTTDLYLSDRSALFYHRRGASIFGLLCAVAHCEDAGIRAEYCIDEAVKPQGSKHIFLNSIDNDKCVGLWRLLVKAFDQLAIPDAVREAVIGLCAVILHIGSCDATKLSGISLQRAQAVCHNMPAFHQAARIIGADTNLFISTTFQSENGLTDSDSDLTPLKCICGFATSVYDTLVATLMSAVNAAFSRIVCDSQRGGGSSSSSSSSVINLLNAPTLRSSNRRGCFPQLVNNYFAERLHTTISALKYSLVLNNLSKECPSFQVNHDWSNWKNKSFKNIQQIVENLNFSPRMKEAGVNGILWLLDHPFLSHEEVITTICSSEFANPSPKTSLAMPIVSIVARPAVFRLAHFSGFLPITYDPADWFAVHRDLPRPPRLHALFECSNRPCMRDISDSGAHRQHQQHAPTKRDKNCGGGGGGGGGTASRILHEMDALLSVVRQSSTVEPVYCLSSTDQQESPKSGSMDDGCVRRQMRMFELVAAGRVFKSLFSQFLTHDKTITRFNALSTNTRIQSCANKAEAVQLLMDEFKLGNQSYSCGRSGVYLRLTALQDLECRRDERVHSAVESLQCLMRGCAARRAFEKKKLQLLAATHIQRNGRAYLRIKQWNWWKLYNQIRSVAPAYSFENRICELEAELAATKRNLARAADECSSVKQINVELERLVEQHRPTMPNGYESEEDGSSSNSDENSDLRAEVDNLKMLVSHRTERIAQLENELRNAPAKRDDEDDDEEEDAVKQLVDRLRDSERAQSNLSNELFDLRFENESKSDRIKELEVQQSAHDEQMGQLRAAFDEISANSEKCIAERDQAVKEVERLEKRVAESVNGYGEEKSPRRRDSASSTATTTSTIDFSSLAGDEAVANTIFFAKAKSKIRSLECKIEDLEAELDDVNLALQSNEQARSKAELQLQQERKRHSLDAEKLEEELDSVRSNFQRRIKLEQDKLEDEMTNSSNLRKQLRVAEMKLSEVRMTAPEFDHGASHSTIGQLRKRILQYKALLNDAHIQLEQTRADLMSQREMNGSRGSLIADPDEKNALKSLRNRVEDLEAEKSALQRSLNSAKGQLDEVSDELEYLKKERVKQEERGRGLQQENADLLGKLEGTEEENADLSRRIDELIKNCSQGQQQVSAMKVESSRLEAENKRLSGRCEKLEQKIREMEGIPMTGEPESNRRTMELENQARLDSMIVQRLRHQVDRLKEQCEKYKSGEISALTKVQTLELDLSQANNKARRCVEELEISDEKLSRLQQERSKLAHSVSTTASEVSHLQNKLRLAQDRIQLLQNALNADAAADDEVDEDEPENINHPGSI